MLDPTDVTAAIARALQPHKVMFLNNSGGLRSQENKARQLAFGSHSVSIDIEDTGMQTTRFSAYVAFSTPIWATCVNRPDPKSGDMLNSYQYIPFIST